MTNVAILYDRC